MRLTLLVIFCFFGITYSKYTNTQQLLTNIGTNVVKQRIQQQHVQRQESDVWSDVIETKSGPVRGTIHVSDRDNTTYAAFLGIPYATPPVGTLRFKGPQPVQPWTEVLNATEEGSDCLTSEDCLFLDVFTPVLEHGPVDNPKAVMVFVHGGVFMIGSKDIYQPGFFIGRDVVFVKLNYRLGPLGFLSLQNEKIPGNAGLKDQLLALKWVKDNIEYFGGDTSRTLLFGESAGSASVSYLQLVKEAKGLFTSVICESASSMGPWPFTEPAWAISHAFNLGNALGCNATGNSDVLYDCLMEADPQEILSKGESALTLHEAEILHLFAFVPTVEPEVEGSLITKRPIEHYLSGDFNHVPMILGLNQREGLLVYPAFESLDPTGTLTTIYFNDMSRFVPYELDVGKNKTQAKEISKRIREFYLGGAAANLAHRLELIDLVTDSHFAIDIQRVTNLLAQHSSSSIWNYYFNYDGPFNLKIVDAVTANISGVEHGDEMGYLMDFKFMQDVYNSYPRDARPHVLVDQFVEMWTNFAKYGDPTPNLDGAVKVKWEPFTPDSHNYLDIGEELIMKQNLHGEAMKFWNDIYEELNGTRPLPE